MMNILKRVVLVLFILASSWPLAGTNAQRAMRTETPLFDSVDENLNPVSMADKIDGRPLVLAVSSCT